MENKIKNIVMEITALIWDFIEAYLPGYYQRDDVLRQSELQLLIDGHQSQVTDLTVEEARQERDKLLLYFFMEAIEAHMKIHENIFNTKLSKLKSKK